MVWMPTDERMIDKIHPGKTECSDVSEITEQMPVRSEEANAFERWLTERNRQNMFVRATLYRL